MNHDGERIAHTPGNWLALPNADGSFTVGAINPDGGWTVICLRNQFESRAEEFKANARLISAAPELLEALQTLVDKLGGAAPGWVPAYAAIAKATGRAT